MTQRPALQQLRPANLHFKPTPATRPWPAFLQSSPPPPSTRSLRNSLPVPNQAQSPYPGRPGGIPHQPPLSCNGPRTPNCFRCATIQKFPWPVLVLRPMALPTGGDTPAKTPCNVRHPRPKTTPRHARPGLHRFFLALGPWDPKFVDRPRFLPLGLFFTPPTPPIWSPPFSTRIFQHHFCRSPNQLLSRRPVQQPVCPARARPFT